MRKRLLSMTLVFTMAVSMLAGCGKASSSDSKATPTGTSVEATEDASATAKLDTSEEVNLVMYVVGDRPAGQDEVDENFNKIIKDKLNCTLTVNWIPWSDFRNKYPLLFSSGEEFDLAYSATWLNFSSLAQQGAFMSLDELWPTYAPKNFARQSESALKQATVNGHYYTVPTLLATYSAYGPVYRTDIMGGTDWAGKMETFQDVEEYCDIVKATHQEMQPLDIYSSGSEWDDTYMYSLGYRSSKGSTNDFLFFDPSQKNPKLFTYYECAQTGDFLEIMNRWNQKGFFSKSALSDTDSTQLQNGKAAMKTHNLDKLADYSRTNPDYKMEYSNFVKNVSHLPYTQDCMVISNTSKNPERAMALWDLLTSDRDVYDAFFYGVLGTTYTLNDKGEYSITDTDLYSPSGMGAVRTTEFNRNAVGTPESYDTWKQTFEDNIASNDTAEKYAGFVLDTSNIATEYAACQSVHQQYWWPLELGYSDAKTGLAEYQKQMEAAGIEKVRVEVQKQLDAYVAGLNK